ncbi:MAG: V-type ATPase subunit [Gammaproteobacteria bacterium]|nr:V-type ATPase subunit [Gammaproteobacteria bacterium]MBL6998395.1 V-type ATPase subunit [Gammaproteobacteria bacterium]
MSHFRSAYLSTRLSLLASRLISFEQLSSLIELELDQIINRVYEWTGHRYQPDVHDSRRIENQLAHTALDDFQILIRPFSGPERRFFYFAIRWFELVNVKVLIRGKFTSTPKSIIQQQLVDLGVFADLPLEKLLETEDPYEMLRLLESTAYAGIVRQARNVFDEQGNDLFLLDATIDKSFFIDLKKRLEGLDAQDVELVEQVMGSLLDRFNLLWLLRYRFSYGLSPAKSYFLLTSTGARLHAADLMRLAKMETIEQLVEALPAKLQQQLQGLTVISDIEQVIEYSTLEVAAKGLSRSGNLVSRAFSYILLREAEMRFLQALIKGKQLGFDQELIRLAVMGAR